jgi:subtilisin family serine protease
MEKHTRTTESEPMKKSLPDVINWQFIVVLRDDVTVDDFLVEHGIAPIHIYEGIINGFAARIPRDRVLELHSDPRIISIERDGNVEGETFWKTQNTQQLDANGDPWGLDRIDQLSNRLTGTYRYQHTGKGVTCYIVDTGIDYKHPEFGGRAVVGFDAFGGNGHDRDGHGTHVAGTVGGKQYGVAKDVTLVSVKVLDDNGNGSWSGILAGLDWISRDHRPKRIVNMSLGGPKNLTINAAVQKLVEAGITVVVAAGNEAMPADQLSPASSEFAITVGASTRNDWFADFSNYGYAVDLSAPGLHIVSAVPGGKVDSYSGTSMAAPHVAGVVALLLEEGKMVDPDDVRFWLYSNAHQNRLKKVPRGTKPHLLFKDRL